VLVYNIHAGKDAAGVPNLERVVALVKSTKADIVLLQEVDKGTGYRTKQQLLAPVLDQQNNELIGVIQIINNKAGVPFGAFTEEGVAEIAQTLAIAFKQRQKPQVVKTKYAYLISDAVLSAGEFALASRSARKKVIGSARRPARLRSIEIR